MLICVTNSKLCQDNFLERIVKISNMSKDTKIKPNAVILREKHLCLEDYTYLAEKCKEILREYNIELIVNTFIEAAYQLGLTCIQVPFGMFFENHRQLTKDFNVYVSVHSIQEADFAAKNKAYALIAGHIYETKCKEGVEPRGIEFLKEVCNAVEIPVFAIGGINAERAEEVMNYGAAGACIMSEFMTMTLL